MPVYTFKCKLCDEEWDVTLPMKDCDGPLHEECPFCERLETDSIVKLLYATPLGDAVRMGFKRPDKSFQQRLRQIASNHKTPQAQGRWGSNVTEI